MVIDDIIMIEPDSAVTSVNVDGTGGVQVHQANVVSDDDGDRQAVLLFPGLTTAQLIDAQGDPIAVPGNTLTVRATEYTVGEHGPERMPAALPPESAYTYAVELSADEVAQEGAVGVEFSQPVMFYVDNFLDFPVGTVVPMGYYDRQRAVWVPSDNGLVIHILTVDPGIDVTIDMDGDGLEESAGDLTLAGIDLDERIALSSLYGVYRCA